VHSRLKKLRALSFAFSIDDAEWHRWYNALATFYLIRGHSSPEPLSGLSDLYLINW